MFSKDKTPACISRGFAFSGDVILGLCRGKMAANGLGFGGEVDLRNNKLSASTELDTKHKASFKHRTRFFTKRLLALVVIFMYFHQILFIESTCVNTSNVVNGKHKHCSV